MKPVETPYETWQAHLIVLWDDGSWEPKHRNVTITNPMADSEREAEEQAIMFEKRASRGCYHVFMMSMKLIEKLEKP